MKALSLMPPWPYAIFNLGKDVENRDRQWSHRGHLIIHASKTWDQAGYDFITGELCLHVPPKPMHVFGALIGKAFMTDCIDRSNSKWFSGQYGYVLKNPEEFLFPIPYRGMPGPFDVPEEELRYEL